MKEYIDRKEAISAIREYRGYFQDQKSTDMMLLKMEAENILKDLETFDVVPVVHGKWIYTGKEMWRCNNCDNEIAGYDKMPSEYGVNYCDRCGAKMDEVKE